LAPADDERREVLRRLADAGLQHLHGVGADGVHLRVELHAQHAVAEIDEAGAGVRLDDGRSVARAAQDSRRSGL
jgi:hypothetical protein